MLHSCQLWKIEMREISDTLIHDNLPFHPTQRARTTAMGEFHNKNAEENGRAPSKIPAPEGGGGGGVTSTA